MSDILLLDRKETEEKERTYGYNSAIMANEEDIARIRRNYAKLINPETKIDELLGRETAVAQQEVVAEPVRRTNLDEKISLVQNARADSDLFRAYSSINRTVAEATTEQDSDEEENEDLRPTPTTIQYRTAGVKGTVEEGKLRNSNAEKRAILNKKEKIIIAVAVSVIIALFALIIINSAIISKLNGDIGTLQSSLTTLKGAYAGISDNVKEYLADIGTKIADFAQSRGMVK